MHKLTLTNNGALLVTQILSQPNIFSTPIEVHRAGKLMEQVETSPPVATEEQAAWLKESFGEIDLTDQARDLLKQAVTKVADKLPPGRVTNSLIEQLGLVD